MKKGLLLLVAAAILAAPLAPALADDSENKIVVNGMVRGRYEYFNNYFDLTDNDESGDVNDDSFGLAPYRAVIGVTGNFSENVSAHIDLQYAGVFGDEFQPQKDIALPVGQGFTPYADADMQHAPGIAGTHDTVIERKIRPQLASARVGGGGNHRPGFQAAMAS